MDLTPTQKDALTELIGIGYGRAANALSELTGFRVTLEVPQITMHELARIPPLLAELVSGEVASVNQPFSGTMSGNAVLMLDEKSALHLSRLLTNDETASGRLEASGREAITEIGNILLNACLGVFGNVLQVQITFAVPRLQMTIPDRVLKSITPAHPEMQYGLMVHTHFHLRDSNVTGYLIIILGIASLDRMLHEVHQWELRQSA